MSNVRSRLAHLEQRTGGKHGECPGCGFRPDAIRTIIFGLSKLRPDGSIPPLVEDHRDGAGCIDQPDRPRCTICGGYMPPIAFIDDFDDSPESTQPGEGTKL